MGDITLTWEQAASIAAGAFAVLTAITGGVWALTNERVKHWKQVHDAKEMELASARKELVPPRGRPQGGQALPTMEKSEDPTAPFKLRSNNKNDLAGLLTTLEGFWEIYHYAFSRKSQEISISLLIVPGQEIANHQIKCNITDYVGNKKYFEDEGCCFAIDGSRLIYFVFDEMTNKEITAYYTHRPVVPERMIYGVLLGVSGGVDGGAQHPAAARVILRYIGRSSDDVKRDCMLRRVKTRIDEAERTRKPLEYDYLRTILKEEVGGYIDLENDPGRAEPRVNEDKFEEMSRWAIELRNDIGKKQAPFVLRAVS